MMDPEIKAQWTAALRSGDYIQGKGYLNTNGKFCCVGVLCEIRGMPRVKVDTDTGAELGLFGPDQYRYETTPDYWTETQPEHYTDPNVFFGIPWLKLMELVNMNDGANGYEKHSFKEIAAHIDETL